MQGVFLLFRGSSLLSNVPDIITFSGDDCERVTPVPIPNTEVKPFSADGTWLVTARESRTLPDSKTKQTPHLWGLFRFGIKQGFAHPGRKRPTCNIVLG